MLVVLAILIASPALAAEPQKFDAFPTTVARDGKTYVGVLVDEETVKELVALRAEVKELRVKTDAMTTRLDEKSSIYEDTLAQLRVQQMEQLRSMDTFYLTRLQEASRRTFIEKNGVPVGLSLGVAVTVASILTAGFVIGETTSIAAP
jgi:hypothetical protein